MKLNRIIYILAVIILSCNTSCTDDFEEINSNPNVIEDIDPASLLTHMWKRYNGSPYEEERSNLIMAGPLSGLITSAQYYTGSGFNGNVDDHNGAKMNELYKDGIKQGTQLLAILREDKSVDNSAKIAIGTISLQFMFQRLTDLYGDIPYHEAGLAYSDAIFYPKYDSQEDIYKSSVDSLKKYRDVLMSTEAAPFLPTGDIFYGSIEDEKDRKIAWAKTANSLILRLGMRASAANVNWAQQTVEEAANNSAGFINTVQRSSAFILNTEDSGGDWGLVINGANFNNALYMYVGEQWLIEAQKNRDPRVFYTAAPIVIGEDGAKPWTGMPEYDAFAVAAQLGEPWRPVSLNPFRGGTEGFAVRGLYAYQKADGSVVSGASNYTVYSDYPDYSKIYTLAGVNPETIGNKAAPIVVFGGDESYFILAEAAKRGWSVKDGTDAYLAKALQLSIEKYPTLFNFGESANTYLQKQSEREGVSLTYAGLQTEYVDRILAKDITLDLIWTERWKSMMSTFTYDAYALWNRTNLSMVTQGTLTPAAEMMQAPYYNESDIASPVLGKEIIPQTYMDVAYHNGGDTEGYRPRRINYPNEEKSVNTVNVEAAMERQKSEHGQVGNGSHFITTRMWISKKD